MRNFCLKHWRQKKIVVPPSTMAVKSKAAVVENEASPSLQKLTEEISALTMVVKSASMGTPKTKHPITKLKLTPLRAMGTRAVMPMEIAPGKAKGQLHQLQDPSNLGKSHYNVINVEAGAICTKNVPHRGA